MSGRSRPGAAGSIRGMRSRRGRRNRDRKRDRFSQTPPLLKQGDTTARPPAAVVEADDVDERRLVMVSDPWFVQFADLTGCDVDGCPAVAVPEAWELVDLDTGDEQPGRFCDEHQLAWIARPRETTSTAGNLAFP
jgi:hypothetical protein